MSLYPASLPTATSASGDVGDGLAACGAMMIAVRAADLVCPERRPARDDRTAVVVAGTGRIRSGELVAFCKVVVVAPAVTRRDGRVQASGKPCDYARLGVLEERLDEIAGADAIGRAAAAVTLKGKVKGAARRSVTTAFILRATLLMTQMPEADYAEVMTALVGDLAAVPWGTPWRVPSGDGAVRLAGGDRPAAAGSPAGSGLAAADPVAVQDCLAPGGCSELVQPAGHGCGEQRAPHPGGIDLRIAAGEVPEGGAVLAVAEDVLTGVKGGQLQRAGFRRGGPQGPCPGRRRAANCPAGWRSTGRTHLASSASRGIDGQRRRALVRALALGSWRVFLGERPVLVQPRSASGQAGMVAACPGDAGEKRGGGGWVRRVADGCGFSSVTDGGVGTAGDGVRHGHSSPGTAGLVVAYARAGQFGLVSFIEPAGHG